MRRSGRPLPSALFALDSSSPLSPVHRSASYLPFYAFTSSSIRKSRFRKSTMSSSSYSPAKIALTATGVVATAFVAYAAYFDYKRRNDPVFRKKLSKSSRALAALSWTGSALGRIERARRLTPIVI